MMLRQKVRREMLYEAAFAFLTALVLLALFMQHQMLVERLTRPSRVTRDGRPNVALLRWFLACLQESFTILLTLLMPLRRRAVVTTCLRKVKHRITAPLPVPRLTVPPLALTVSTRMPMFARMPSS